MIKIKDKLTLGIAAAIIANIIVSIIDLVCYKLNINQFNRFQIAASPYFQVPDVDTIPAIIVGIIADFSVAAFFGVIMVYILFYTGADFYYVKGLFVALIFWLILYGIVLRLNIARIDPVDPGTNLVHLAIHLILGLLTAWIITKHGIPPKNRSDN
jgi:hypothetical protein